MSNSRYIATESQLTISPSNSCARARDRAVFPPPVGPRITASSGSEPDFTPCSPPTSAQAPVNVVPVSKQGENQQEKSDQHEPGGLRRVNCMPVLFRCRLVL